MALRRIVLIGQFDFNGAGRSHDRRNDLAGNARDGACCLGARAPSGDLPKSVVVDSLCREVGYRGCRKSRAAIAGHLWSRLNDVG
jgi:hypothetical protein